MAPGIVAVTDAYDAMTRARVFRDAMTPEAALAEIQRCGGTQFDRRVVEAFLATGGAPESGALVPRQ